MKYASEQLWTQANANVNASVFGTIIINVKAFGAFGDGIHDDTAAIQNAINYARSIGKSEVVFPAGTYKYTTLTNTEGMTFVGDGVTLTGITPITLTNLSKLDDTASKVNNRLHFLKSANTGDCTVIQLSDGKSMIIDSHASSNATHTLEYIAALGITHIDYVVITHYHGDHMGNIPNLTSYFDEYTTFFLPQDVNASVVYPEIVTNQNTVKSVIFSRGCVTVYPAENQKVTLSNEVVLQFINTDHTAYYASSNFDYNNCSLCNYFKSNNTEMLFTGDIGLEAQTYLADKVRPVDIYKAHHHSSDLFLNTVYMTAVMPEISVCMDSNDIYYNLIASSFLQHWLQNNSIPIYPTSRNGDIVLVINEAGYAFASDCSAFTTQVTLDRFANDKFIRRFLFQSFDEIFQNYNGTNYNNTKTLVDIINAMPGGTEIQTTIPQSHAACPPFISSYGAYIKIEKSDAGPTSYARVWLTDRNPLVRLMWKGNHQSGEGNVTITDYRPPTVCKYITGGTNYNANVETKGTLIPSYTYYNDGYYSNSSGSVNILKDGWYRIAPKFTANIQYSNSEVRMNVYKNGSILFAVTQPASITGFTYASVTEVLQLAAGDVLEVKFIPTTAGASTVNISSALILEQV